MSTCLKTNEAASSFRRSRKGTTKAFACVINLDASTAMSLASTVCSFDARVSATNPTEHSAILGVDRLQLRREGLRHEPR